MNVATNKQIDPVKLRKQLMQDLSPSMEQQSMGFVQWQEMGNYLGQPFDATSIPLTKLRQMRRDPMIAFSLQYVKLPLVRAPWFIECEDARIAAFMTEALRLVYERLMMQFSLKYDYGYQAIVKNFTTAPVDWTYQDVNNPNAMHTAPVWTGSADPVLWKPFSTIQPEHVTPEWTDSGDFNGFFRSYQTVPGAMRTNDPNGGYVDVNHALWVTNEKDSKFGSIWGYPRIGYAYRFWWSYWYAWALRDRWMERTSDPSVIVRYPADRVIDDVTGEILNLQQIAESLGENIRAGATVTLPNDMVSDADGNPTNQPAWEVSYLEQSGKTSQEFQELFNYLDVMKLRSCLIPERALIVPAARASASGVTEQLADFFTESQATEMVEFGDMVNRYMIPQLVQVNFPEYKGKCRWVSRGFSSADRTLIMQLLTLVGQKTPEKLDLDIREVMAQLQVPLKTPEQVAKEKQDELDNQEAQYAMQAKMAMLKGHNMAAGVDSTGSPTKAQVAGNNAPKVKKGQMGPENTHKIRMAELDAIPGVRAGINSEGLYYDPRQRIELDAPSPFAHKIGDLRYFNGEDDSLQIAQDIYEIWYKTFKKIYKQASKHVKERLVTFAEGGIDEDAGRAIAHQINLESLIKDAVERMTTLNQRLAAIAAHKEMTDMNLPIEWIVDNQDMRDWMRIHGAQLVRNVTESTRKELAELISDELGSGSSPEMISRAIQDKFDEWPSWKAERIARSEARDAYNAGTLLAAQKAGLTQARASDASGGRNNHTDRECIERNGKVFPISEALHIQDHPNGTLAWAPIVNLAEEVPQEDDTTRLKESVRRAQTVKWQKQDGKWWANLGHALVSHDGPNQPAKTVTARLIYLTDDLEEDVEINLSQESHPFADVTTGPGVINFYDVKRKLGNGSKIPEDLYLSALAEGVLE